MGNQATIEVEKGVLFRGLEEAIRTFEQDFPLEEFKKGDYGQHPQITLLTCSDSRMPAEIFGTTFNRIFSVENIGNQVKTNEGSILYGLLHLHTPVMIVVGHSDCGAIKAAESNFIDEPMGIRDELSVVKNSLEEARRKSGLSFDAGTALSFSQLAEVNVDMQIDYLLANHAVADLVGKNELLLLGVMMDLHDVYGNGYGVLYTSNINGERNSSILKSYSHLGLLADQARRLTSY